jgi:hypothetical protein
MLMRASLVVVGLCVVFAACGGGSSGTPDAGDAGPQVICQTPSALAPIHFTDVTSDYLGTFAPLANSVYAADFDGDGWSDILITTGWSQAGNYEGTSSTDPNNGQRVRHLLMSRPSPTDATQRIFVDTTDASGILASPSGNGERGFGIANAGDLDDDGDIDLITCPQDYKSIPGDDVTDGCAALLNDGTGVFTLAPGSALGENVFWVPSAALLDYDRDGYLDFWPATVAHWPYPVTPALPNTPPTLFRGNGDGTFQNVSAAVGLPTEDGFDATGTSFRHVFGITACDIDGDGDDDVIFADYGRQENQVWLNNNGQFTNVAHTLGVDYDDDETFTDDQTYMCFCQNNPGQCAMSEPTPVAGFCCGFCTNDTCTPSCGPNGRGWEPGVSDQPYSLGGNNFTIACGDIDDDGDMDLMSATIVHADVGQSADPSELILNPGTPNTKFSRPGNSNDGLLRVEPSFAQTGTDWNLGDNLVVFVDLDLDGRKDIFLTDTAAYDIDGVVQDSHNYLWHQLPDGTFQEIIMSTGLLAPTKLPHLEGPVFIDIDGDGDLDMIAGDASTLQLHVFRNDSGQQQNWTRIRLVGAGAAAANTSGIGAIVRVAAGGRTQTQYVSGGFGHGNNQNDVVLTFGLGTACAIDSIDVRWPDSASTHSTFTGVLPNHNVTLRQGQTAAEYH